MNTKLVFSKSVGDGHKPRTPMAAGSTLKLSTDFHGDRAFLPAPNRDRYRFIENSWV